MSGIAKKYVTFDVGRNARRVYAIMSLISLLLRRTNEELAPLVATFESSNVNVLQEVITTEKYATSFITQVSTHIVFSRR